MFLFRYDGRNQAKLMKKIGLNVAMTVGGVMVALLLLEIFSRMLPPPYDYSEGAYICSNELGWRGKPDYVETNNTEGYVHQITHNRAGMHDTDHPFAKPENTFRILVLGDSFTQAVQVRESETTHQVLEDLLNRPNQTKKFEVISAAVTGWSTGQQLIYYRNEGRLYQPNLVFLMVYLGNDVIGNLPGEGRTLAGRNCYSPYFVVCEGQFDMTPWLYAPGIEPAPGACSPLKKLLTTILGKTYQYSRLYAQIEPLFPDRHYSSQTPYYPLYLPEENSTFDYAWEVTVATINQLHKEVKSDGAELVVVLISPADVIAYSQMNASELEVIYQKVPDLRQAQLDLPHRKLSERLLSTGIIVLDLQPFFIQHLKDTGESLYFPQDKHWNVEGNQFVAEILFNQICCEKAELICSDCRFCKACQN